MDIALIPDSAPFTSAQRAWLNGFLAGWLGVPGSGPPSTGNGLPALASPAEPAKPAPAPATAPEPWHDPSLPIADRLKLADGAPLPDRLMAAMAQLDCGACGYVCRTYSEAIADGAETRLSLCSPGGSETSKAIKRLLKESPPNGPPATNGAAKNGVHVNGAAKNGTHVNGASANGKAPAGWSRANPYTARVLKTVNLNRPGSEKETRHVEIDLGPDGPSYEVGDSLGVYPENCPDLVNDLLDALGADGGEPVAVSGGSEATLRDALIRHCCLSEVTEDLLTRLAEATADADESARLLGLIDDDGPVAGFDVLDLLRLCPGSRPSPAELVAALSPIKPRLYSLSSSPKRHAGQAHLTVRRVSYAHNGRGRKGAASTMLADRVGPGSPVRVFVQKSHGFTLPADPAAPVVMIGPGTGVAPFRAFLHERDATAAPGKSWLFFGDQRGSHDFLYEDELTDFLRRGVLTRLDTAFSRDHDRKVYVQHRIREQGGELFRWLEAGAHVYVCGDAKRMAADVDRALREVVREQGRMNDDTAVSYVASLTSAGRYRRDVY